MLTTKKLDWKNLRTANDVGRIVCNVKSKVIELVHGNLAKNRVGLNVFSSFAKLSTFFTMFEDFNCRVRETAIVVAISLWDIDSIKGHVWSILRGRIDVLKNEHRLVQNNYE